MSGYRFTEKEQQRIERGFERTRRAWEVLDVIVGEFESDPSSVQCFDQRIVKEAKQLVADQRREADYLEPLGRVEPGRPRK